LKKICKIDDMYHDGVGSGR